MKKISVVVIGMVVISIIMIQNGQAADVTNGTVTDSSTGLVWLQNADCFDAAMWDQALSKVKGLKSGSCGLTDGSTAGQWRLPSKEELTSRSKNKKGFNKIQLGWYWSGTEQSNNNAWCVNMGSSGKVDYTYKKDNRYVWPVREGKKGAK